MGRDVVERYYYFTKLNGQLYVLLGLIALASSIVILFQRGEPIKRIFFQPLFLAGLLVTCLGMASVFQSVHEVENALNLFVLEPERFPDHELTKLERKLSGMRYVYLLIAFISIILVILLSMKKISKKEIFTGLGAFLCAIGTVDVLWYKSAQVYLKFLYQLAATHSV